MTVDKKAQNFQDWLDILGRFFCLMSFTFSANQKLPRDMSHTTKIKENTTHIRHMTTSERFWCMLSSTFKKSKSDLQKIQQVPSQKEHLTEYNTYTPRTNRKSQNMWRRVALAESSRAHSVEQNTEMLRYHFTMARLTHSRSGFVRSSNYIEQSLASHASGTAGQFVSTQFPLLHASPFS
jgi:hypothetical protein